MDTAPSENRKGPGWAAPADPQTSRARARPAGSNSRPAPSRPGNAEGPRDTPRAAGEESGEVSGPRRHGRAAPASDRTARETPRKPNPWSSAPASRPGGQGGLGLERSENRSASLHPGLDPASTSVAFAPRARHTWGRPGAPPLRPLAAARPRPACRPAGGGRAGGAGRGLRDLSVGQGRLARRSGRGQPGPGRRGYGRLGQMEPGWGTAQLAESACPLRCVTRRLHTPGASAAAAPLPAGPVVHQGQELLRPEEKRDKMVSNIAEWSKET
uniref:Translation initiation factor IF-2-like n=1 Tax=Tursiops truncatus TaxID=9739 RepID=A0A6J3PVD6_TURTR|nr:translation initiation factor IF-2-like [Tursiops truncatus]